MSNYPVLDIFFWIRSMCNCYSVFVIHCKCGVYPGCWTLVDWKVVLFCVLNAIFLALLTIIRPRPLVGKVWHTRRTIYRDTIRDSVLIDGQGLLSTASIKKSPGLWANIFATRFRCEPIVGSHGTLGAVNVNEVVCSELRLSSYQAVEMRLISLLLPIRCSRRWSVALHEPFARRNHC